MGSNGVFEFSPSFKEFLPVYRDVTRVWIGNGITTGKDGMLYAEYADGTVAELGSVSLYATAVEQGYTGTERDWVLMIMSVSQLVTGSTASISYKVSNSGTVHPDPSSGWSPTPVFEKGKFTWAKIDLTWIDTSTTTFYMASYQGQDGQVESVNGEIGNIILHGENLPIEENSEISIKDYIDEAVIPEVCTEEEIDAMFSMAFFSGAAFLTGRHFVEGDSITYKIEALTPNAPMPELTQTTVYPTSGSSWNFKFGQILYKNADIPTGQTTMTYVYRISELSHSMSGVQSQTDYHDVSVTLTDLGDGTIAIDRSPNFNSLFFVYEYSAKGRIIFEGSITLNGRRMAAREFMIQIKEGAEIVAENISTTTAASTGEPSAIAFPAINYTLEDIGTHIYTVKQTSVSGDGVTIDNAVYTVTVYVKDELPDGTLEIETDGTDKNIDFTNTYAASGVIIFNGTYSMTRRLFRNGDTLNVSLTGSAKLPSPASISVPLTIGESSADFAFASLQYTLDDMRNISGGYDDIKTFLYTATENAHIPGVTPDGIIHTISVRVTDDKLGHLVIEPTYSDSNKIQFNGSYDAFGTIIFVGQKRLVNRNFVATDRMYATITSTNGGRLPHVSTINVPLTVGQNTVDFSYVDVTYQLSDLSGDPNKTFNYIISENTVITGATNDSDTHTVDVYVADNYDGTLTVTPTYSDGNKAIFTSVYDATGFIAIIGSKTIVNRSFKTSDILNVAITSTNGGKLPNPSSISVPLTVGSNNANFSFAQITYKIVDLDGLSTKTFNYTVTETINMDGTTPESISDTVSVVVSDNTDGTLSVMPTYTSGNKISFVNVYSAYADLDFKARCIFTNGNMSSNPFTVRITQVTGNHSTTQATSNVVLAAPVTMTANSGNVQDLTFDDIVHFVKNSSRDDTQATCWFLIEEVLPAIDSQGIYNNVKYDTAQKWVNVTVTDDFDGTLVVTKTPAPDISTGLDMTFTNEQLADLVIGETWSGDDDRLTTVEKNAFTYIVTGPNDYSETFTYADMTNNVYTLQHLKLGEYTLIQTNNIVENFNIATSYSVGASATNRIDLTSAGGRINVSNVVNKLEATLNIAKIWAGDHNLLTEQQKNVVTFTVTGPKQKSTDAYEFSQTFTYADMVDSRKVFERLTLGTYTVVETNYEMQDFDATVVYTVNGVTMNEVVLNDNDSKTITVTDTYAQHKGTAKVTKQFVGIVEALKPVNFNITNNYNDSVFTYANADNAATADGIIIPYEWTIGNIPVHTTVQFTEYNTAIENHTLATTAVPSNRTCAPIAKNTVSAVSLTNEYVMHVGNVKVTKQFTGITAAQKPDTFTITNDYNDSMFTYANADNTATADGVVIPYEWTITNVPVTTTIRFTEHNATITDYDLTASAVPSNFTCAAVTKDNTSTVAITNAYVIHKGSAKVTKQFEGLTTSQLPNNFNITNNYNASVFTYANADNAGSADGITTPYEWTINNIPVHTTVEFTENNANVTNYTLTAVANPADYTCAAIVKDTVSTVTINNTYVLDTGSVKVTKLFSGLTTSQLPNTFQITNDYNASVFTFANADNAGTADGVTIPYEWTILDVPVTTVIEFTEHNVNVDDYEVISSSVPADFTCSPVAKGYVSIVNITNEYIHDTGSIKVTKLYSGLSFEDLPELFNITNDYDDSVFTYQNADNASTADGITIPYEWVIDDVPTGTTITFTENNTEVTGYELQSNTEIESNPVIKDTTEIVSFVNTYEVASEGE